MFPLLRYAIALLLFCRGRRGRGHFVFVAIVVVVASLLS
jgi:hypothetical protein